MSIAEAEELFEEEEDTQKDKYLSFPIGNEFYGIEIRYVTEIIGLHPITEVPQLPEYIRGIINLRGKIIPVMDVRMRFKKEFKEYDERTSIIVIDVEDVTIGLIVDRVSEVLVIPETDIMDRPDIKKGGDKYIKCVGTVGQEVKLILDCDRLIDE